MLAIRWSFHRRFMEASWKLHFAGPLHCSGAQD